MASVIDASVNGHIALEPGHPSVEAEGPDADGLKRKYSERKAQLVRVASDFLCTAVMDLAPHAC